MAMRWRLGIIMGGICECWVAWGVWVRMEEDHNTRDGLLECIVG